MRLRPNLFIFILILLAEVTVFGKGLIVTDVDDTVRATNTRTVVNQLTRIVQTSNAFSGAASFLKLALNSGRMQKVFYVSAGPTVFQGIYEKFLSRSGFPEGSLTLKSGGTSSFDYKLKTISDIIAAENPDEVLLLGDNSQYDSRVYHQLAERFPNVKFTTLIHQVYSGSDSAEIFSEQHRFLTFGVAAAIALEKGFLDQSGFDQILEELIADAQSEDPKVRQRVVDSYFEVKDFFAIHRWPQRGLLLQLGQLILKIAKAPGIAIRCEASFSESL